MLKILSIVGITIVTLVLSLAYLLTSVDFSITSKLLFLVYFIENVTTWYFYTFSQVSEFVFVCCLVLVILSCFGYFLFGLHFYDDDINFTEVLERYSKTIKSYIIYPIILILLVGMFGSVMNSLIPNKKTAWLMAGAYVTGSTIEACVGDNTACSEIINRLNSKALEALGTDSLDIIKPLNDVTEKTFEKIETSIKEIDTSSVNESVKNVSEVTDKITKTLNSIKEI